MLLLLVLLLSSTLGRARQLVSQGPYALVYDTALASAKFYLNDHTVVLGPGGVWRVVGITHTEPADPEFEQNLDLALSPSLKGPFQRQSFALGKRVPETFLWAPHIVPYGNSTWLMYYCGGGADHEHYQIRWALSSDLVHWTRLGTLFTGGADARDPMVTNLGPSFNNSWALYYCATDPNAFTNSVSHVTYVRTTDDLLSGNWSAPRIAFVGGVDGAPYGGPTESPFVVRRGQLFYLLSGSWAPSYNQTRVFVSKNPLWFGNVTSGSAVQVGQFESHAPEMVRDVDGSWYVTGAGWGMGGLYMSKLSWDDGQNDDDTSLPIPNIPSVQAPNFRSNLGLSDWRAPNGDAVWTTTSSGLSGYCALDNAFLISTVTTPGDASHFLFSSTIRLVTANGNAGPGPWEREGSAAALCWFSQTDASAGSTCCNLSLSQDGSVGTVKLFRFPYEELVAETVAAITNDVDLQLSVEAWKWDRNATLYKITVAAHSLSYLDTSGAAAWAGSFGLNVWQGAATFQDTMVGE